MMRIPDRMRRLRVIAAVVVVMTLLFPAFRGYQFVQAAEGDETVRLVVELKDVEGDIATRRDLRRAIREVRKMSERAPRDYAVDGERRRAADLRRWRVVEVNQAKAGQLLVDLKSNPAVVSVHVERVYEAALLPDDPRLSDQYGLVSNNPLADINAAAAWDKTTGSGSTVIAVVDGGVDLTHEDLAGKIWVNSGEVPGNGVDDDGNGFVDDVHGWDFANEAPAGVPHKHGTHVAGIAAASSNNGVGITGVDWAARIMSVRVLRSSGVGREEWIIRGINYAVANGADIINLSLIGPASPALAAAVENAYASGVVVVAAAGNSRLNTSRIKRYPVCADVGGVNMVLGVGATDDKGEPASFSNYGDCVDVSAPGKRIWSTVSGDRYKRMSGTSMSSPLAAGVAGLYLALHPGASPAEVIAAVSAGDAFTGKRADDWNRRFKGRLNAARVVGAPFDEPENGSTALPDSGAAELSIDKTGPGEAAPGATVTYTIMVGNIGSAVAQDVLVKDRFDRELVFAAVSSSESCSEKRRNIECLRDSLAAGESVTFTLSFLVAEDVRCSARFRDRASVYMDEGGRSRRQARSERVTTQVSCSQ